VRALFAPAWRAVGSSEQHTHTTSAAARYTHHISSSTAVHAVSVMEWDAALAGHQTVQQAHGGMDTCTPQPAAPAAGSCAKVCMASPAARVWWWSPVYAARRAGQGGAGHWHGGGTRTSHSNVSHTHHKCDAAATCVASTRGNHKCDVCETRLNTECDVTRGCVFIFL
jgi:hypothetical protein